MKLLTINNHKTTKGESKGYLTGILYLDPTVKGICPNATRGCKAACLFTAGRGAMNSVQRARRRKTEYYLSKPQAFLGDLISDIGELDLKAMRQGLTPCIRLNGTSDIDWASLKDPIRNKNIFEIYPYVQFYDYTKRFDILSNSFFIPNYHVTMSRSEINDRDFNGILSRLHSNENLAVVFEKDLPKTYMGRKVINGDENDLRFLDPKGVIVGLKAKGKAKHDTTGFVVRQIEKVRV